jgi:hypothetical protein
MVHEEDFPYVDAMLRDFIQRSAEQPRELFRQLSSLGVGPLVTQQAGSDFEDHSAVRERVAEFAPLQTYLED